MSKRDEIFDKLKAGVPWKEIEGSTKSRSNLYEKLNEYLVWVDQRVEDQRRLKKETDQEVTNSKEKLKAINANVSKLESSKEALEDEVSVVQNDLNGLRMSHAIIESAYNDLHSKYIDLKKQGVTDGAISFLNQVDFESDEELRDRIKSAESYLELQEELGELKQTLESLKVDIKKEELKKQSTQDQVTAERVNLDEARRRNLAYKRAHDVVQGYLKEYSVDQLLSILPVLANLAIKGEPETSIKRLVDGLQGVKNLEELMSECRKLETYRSEMKLERDRATAEVEVMKDVFLALLKDLTGESYDQIEKLVTGILSQMEAISLKLGEYEGVQRTQLEKYRINTEASLRQIGDAQQKHLNNKILQLNALIQQYESLVRQWGKQKQEEGALAEHIAYGRIIRNVRGGNVKDLPVDVIYQLCRAVQGFIQSNMPDVKIKPMKKTADMDTNLNKYQDYRLLAIAEILTNFFYIKAAGKNYEDFLDNIWSL